ncbi:MAG: hypothetical protein Ct9H90mP22_5100 [Gammaproteobacteria bacterium]|nr:MAG: hypothetical protein Ct9H90mP22_5100 [Gammaproteobacteria bacterium]
MNHILVLKFQMKTQNIYMFGWDAPIGYLSSIKNWCDSNNIDFNDFINDSKIFPFYW